VYACVVALLVRRPVRIIEVFHTTDFGSRGWSRLKMWFYSLLFRRCDLLVYVSHAQREYWTKRRLRARRDVVIQNGIDAERFTDRFTTAEKAACRAQYGFGADDYVIGICAVLRPEKAHGDLLAAVQRLREAGLNVRVLLIGDGPQRSAIEAEISRLRLDGVAAITGFLKDVRLHVASCDVMVLASHTVETFSIAALESMALGKPVVLTRIGGAAEQVTPGLNGFLYEPGDIAALRTHLATLADKHLRQQMGAHAVKVVREQFTLEKMVAAYDRELAQLIGIEQPASTTLAQANPRSNLAGVRKINNITPCDRR
jgi:glycosyltransferase involved in cell wall biosynthesis